MPGFHMHDLPDAIVLSLVARAPRLTVAAKWLDLLPATPPRRGGVYWLRVLAKHDGDLYSTRGTANAAMHVYHLLQTIQRRVGLPLDDVPDALRTIAAVIAVYPDFKRDLRYRVVTHETQPPRRLRGGAFSCALDDLYTLVDRLMEPVPTVSHLPIEVVIQFMGHDPDEDVTLQHNTGGWQLVDRTSPPTNGDWYGDLRDIAGHAPMPVRDLPFRIMESGTEAPKAFKVVIWNNGERGPEVLHHLLLTATLDRSF